MLLTCLRDLARGISRIQGVVREHGGARRALARTDVGTAGLSVSLMRSPIDAAKRRAKKQAMRKAKTEGL